MVKRSGSEQMQPDRRRYLAIERARHDALSSHPKGRALPAQRSVEAPDRALRPSLHTSPSAALGRSHVTALADGPFGP